MTTSKTTSTRGPVQIAPSILSADFARLGAEVTAIERAGADLVHVDVMDGHFVPNLTLGPPVISCLKKVATTPLDVHLMIDNPERFISDYAEAGADWISVHAEVAPHLDRLIQQIKLAGAKPGVVLNPHTPLEVLDYVLGELHHVLLMTVNPGFGGQQFIPRVIPKIAQLRAKADAQGLDLRIQVDGGVKTSTIAAARRAGADVFVAGSAVFRSEDYAASIAELRKVAQGAG